MQMNDWLFRGHSRTRFPSSIAAVPGYLSYRVFDGVPAESAIKLPFLCSWPNKSGHAADCAETFAAKQQSRQQRDDWTDTRSLSSGELPVAQQKHDEDDCGEDENSDDLRAIHRVARFIEPAASPERSDLT